MHSLRHIQMIQFVKNRLELLWKVQKQRYRLKGPTNILMASALLILYFWAFTALGRRWWPDHVENQAQFVMIATICSSLIPATLVFFAHLPGYLGNKAYKKYQNNTEAPRPWQKKDWPEVLKASIQLVCFNQLVGIPFLAFLGTQRKERAHFGSFPTLQEVIAHITFLYLMDDLLNHTFHRAFHEVPFLHKLHKVHHSYNSLHTWVNTYTHPIQLVIANAGPPAMAIAMLGSHLHCFTYIFWGCLKSFLSTQGHSGYEFPWSPFRVLPLVMGSNMHDYHHSCGLGTYANTFYLYDLATCTSEEYFKKFLALKPKAE